MSKQPRSKKSENNVGKGKVTPIQVAFIVDRYLADNNFTQTRSIFRNEASSFLAKTSLDEAPKSLLMLGDMLDEYITLKEQKVILDQRKCQLEQETCRVQNLLQGMQDLMTAYNSPAGCLTPPPPHPPPPSLPRFMAGKPVGSSPAGYPADGAPMITSSSMPHNKRIAPASFSASNTILGPPRKRKCYKAVPDANQITKKTWVPPPCNQLPDKGVNAVSRSANEAKRQDGLQQCSMPQSLPPNCVHEGSPTQGRNVAVNLFNQRCQSPASNSSGPKTPLREISSQIDKSNSPHGEISSVAKCNRTHIPQNTTPTKCTIISSKTIIASPDKRFSIVRNHCTFSSPVKTNLSRQGKRDHVKARLDFDSSDAPNSSKNVVGLVGTSALSASENEGDIFDLEVPNLDVFGPDFCLSELLSDFDIDGLDYACEATLGASTDTVPGSSCEPKDDNSEANRDPVDCSSSMSGDIMGNGKESIISVQSLARCIRISSPVKKSQTPLVVGELTTPSVKTTSS